MYARTTISNPSPGTRRLSQELAAFIRERRAQDPKLGLPDVLAAIELLKLSLLSESGITVARSRVLVVTVGLLLAAVVTFLFLSSR